MSNVSWAMNKLTLIHWLARGTLAFVFFFHGLVPKLLWTSDTERFLVISHTLPLPSEWVIYGGGLFEIFLALAILLMKNVLWPVGIASVLLAILLADVAVIAPDLLLDAFNPVTLNLSGIVLCTITYLSWENTNEDVYP